MKKYEFTGETKVSKANEVGGGKDGIVLHQIRAIRDFGEVKAGDLGGWIESEQNLSHQFNSWVDANGEIYGNILLADNAYINCDEKGSMIGTVCEGRFVGYFESAFSIEELQEVRRKFCEVI